MHGIIITIMSEFSWYAQKKCKHDIDIFLRCVHKIHAFVLMFQTKNAFNNPDNVLLTNHRLSIGSTGALRAMDLPRRAFDVSVSQSSLPLRQNSVTSQAVSMRGDTALMVAALNNKETLHEPLMVAALNNKETLHEPLMVAALNNKETLHEPLMVAALNNKETLHEPLMVAALNNKETLHEPLMVAALNNKETLHEPLMFAALNNKETLHEPLMVAALNNKETLHEPHMVAALNNKETLHVPLMVAALNNKETLLEPLQANYNGQKMRHSEKGKGVGVSKKSTFFDFPSKRGFNNDQTLDVVHHSPFSMNTIDKTGTVISRDLPPILPQHFVDTSNSQRVLLPSPETKLAHQPRDVLSLQATQSNVNQDAPYRKLTSPNTNQNKMDYHTQQSSELMDIRGANQKFWPGEISRISSSKRRTSDTLTVSQPEAVTNSQYVTYPRHLVSPSAIIPFDQVADQILPGADSATKVKAIDTQRFASDPEVR